MTDRQTFARKAAINKHSNTSFSWPQTDELESAPISCFGALALKKSQNISYTLLAFGCILLQFGNVQSYPYPSANPCGKHTVAPVPVKQPCRIWANKSYTHTQKYDIATTKQSTTKPRACFAIHTVHRMIMAQVMTWPTNQSGIWSIRVIDSFQKKSKYVYFHFIHVYMLKWLDTMLKYFSVWYLFTAHASSSLSSVKVYYSLKVQNDLDIKNM